jgi:hypothetical protein
MEWMNVSLERGEFDNNIEIRKEKSRYLLTCTGLYLPSERWLVVVRANEQDSQEMSKFFWGRGAR